MHHPLWLSWAAVIVVTFSLFSRTTLAIGSDDNSVTCAEVDADIVFVIDTTSSNSTSFLIQQHRLLRTLKRLANVLKDRSVRYGVIGFSKQPELLLELESPFATDTERVSDVISTLRPKQSTSNSAAKALEEAMSLFFESRTAGQRRKVVILAHDGLNTDLVAETLEAVSNVEKLGAITFAITGSSRPNAYALLGYTGARERIFIAAADRETFQATLDEALGVCTPSSEETPTSKELKKRLHGVRGRRADDEKRIFTPGQKCGFDKVDLALVLDTSGSVFRVFEDQRQIALDMLDEIPLAAYNDAVQVSVTRFAANADVMLPFLRGRSIDEIKDTVKEVKFTGQNTRIAGAVEIALDEMERARRKDARQVFVLISDGHGQEYWNVVQATGKRLQDANAELFAVSASRDYNEQELLIYVGDKSRVFVGDTYTNFLPMITSYMNDCLGKSGGKTLARLQSKFKTTSSFSFSEETAATKRFLLLDILASTSTIEPTFTEVSEFTEFTEGSLPSETEEDSTTSLPSEAEEDTTNEVPTDEASGDENIVSTTTETIWRITDGIDDGDVQVLDGVREKNEGLRDTDESSEDLSRARQRDLAEALSCDVDLVMIIDTTSSVEDTFQKEIALANRTAELFAPKDFSSGKIQAGAVSFSRNARLELKFGRNSRDFVLHKFGKIRYTEGNTSSISSVSGARLAVQRLVMTRRPSARLVVLLLTDGISQDRWRELIETSMNIHDVPNSAILAYTPSRTFSERELQVWAGENAKVFLSDEENKFLHAVNKEVKRCGKSASVSGAGEVEEIAKKKDRKLQTEWTVARDEMPTTRSPPRATTTGEQTTTRRVPQRFRGTSTAATTSTEQESTTSRTGGRHRQTSAVQLETRGSTSTTPRPTTTQRPITSTRSRPTTFELRPVTADLITEGSAESSGEKGGPVTSPLPEEPATTIETLFESTTEVEDNAVTEGGDEGSGLEGEERRAQGIRTAKDLPKIEEAKHAEAIFEKAGPTPISSCLTDLMFVIDTSTSVEGEFQRQLQFAVDLVKRLPTEDFEHRVRVGVVVFNQRASLVLPIYQPRSRSAVLDSLLSTNYSGGSTSVASGVNMAVDEIEKHRRKDARLMLVLVSDGNSQDHWDEVIRSSNRLRTTGADVYAVTISKKYMFRELELYAGDKLRVYIDARVRQFLDETEKAVTHCEGASSGSSLPLTLQAPKSCSSLVDLLIILDTSASAEDFFKEKQIAVDLLRVLPESVFEKRLSVSIVTFANTSSVSSSFGLLPKDEVVFELERIGNSTGPPSLASASTAASVEIKAHRRENSRVMVIIVSNGQGGEDKFEEVKKTSAALKSSGAEIFAVSLSDTPNVDKLREYTGSNERLYVAEKSDKFIKEIGSAILSCSSASGVNNVETEDALRRPDIDFNEKLEQFRLGANRRQCKYNKMDLQIILDASSSRKEVFEHQRELALSLIERLPISADGSHVAVGVSSFTSVPTLRQSLGLGKDKAAIRQAIESIKYKGGSTLTAQAVDLSVDDLLRGKRPEALQVVVLMNDGMSQDPWDRVLTTSERLAATKAERFGVALGKEVDLRELHHYIGRNDRIYRDGTTEKFLNDIVALLEGEKDCPEEAPQREGIIPRHHQFSNDECAAPNQDFVVVFDNTERTENKRDSAINANRYLLLDVLGSLKHGARVRVSLIAFYPKPQVTVDFTDISERDKIFAKIEAIKTISEEPSYSDAVSLALDHLHNEGRADAKASIIILGNGKGNDSLQERIAVANRMKETPTLNCLAVDSSPSTDINSLKLFTGSRERVFPYERNAEFARQINRLATVADNPKCQFAVVQHSVPSVVRDRVYGVKPVTPVSEWVYSTSGPVGGGAQPEEDNNISPTELSILLEETDGPPEEDDTTDEITEATTRATTTRRHHLTTQRHTTTTTTTAAPTTRRHHLTTQRHTTTTTTTEEPTTTHSTTHHRRLSLRPRTSTTTTTTTTTTTRPTTKHTTKLYSKRIRPSPPPTEPTTRTTHTTTTPVPITTRAPTSPSYTHHFTRRTTEEAVESSTVFKRGCLIDMIIVLDSSGSVEETFRREKELAAGIISRLRIGPDNARVTIIRFAGSQSVRTVYSFDDPQSKNKILRVLEGLHFSSGTTAIDAALVKAFHEYTVDNGARPGHARPVAVIFTDGYGRRSALKAAEQLRHVVPDTYAIAINHTFAIARPELEVIVGQPERVFTDENIGKFHDILENIAKDCIVN